MKTIDHVCTYQDQIAYLNLDCIFKSHHPSTFVYCIVTIITARTMYKWAFQAAYTHPSAEQANHHDIDAIITRPPTNHISYPRSHSHLHPSRSFKMGRPRNKLFAQETNVTEEPKRRRTGKKPDPDEEQEAEDQFLKEVEQARRLFAGEPLNADAAPHGNNRNGHAGDNEAMAENEDAYYQGFLPADIVEDDGNPEWVDVDAAVERFVQKHRGYRYAQQRKRLRLQWTAIENQLTAAYLHSELKTLNWTTQHSYLGRVHVDCKCPAAMCYRRNVDLIDVLERHVSTPVRFCPCMPEAVQLVHQGYIPSSPKTPRTAFSIRLLQLYHFIWQASACAASSFIEGLMNYLDRRSSTQLKARGHCGNRCNLTQAFSNASHVHTRTVILAKELLQSGLELKTSDLWAERCGRCFGPAEAEKKVSPEELDVIICMDGNFQHRHNALASKDCPEESDYPSIFIRPSQIVKHDTTLPNNPTDDPCSEAHKTANDTRTSKTWDRCDDTGLFAAACRHDVPLLLANIYKSGEKMYYPLSLLEAILNEFPTKRFGILYDIGCHLEKYIIKHNLIPQHQGRMVFGTSVFHAYVHSWTCQLFYNPRFRDYWGLSDGEGLERTWSFLSCLIACLRVATRLHRLQAIDLRCDYLALRHQMKTGEWLSRRLNHTITTMKEAQHQLDQLCKRLNTYDDHDEERTYTPDFFAAQWKAEREANIATAQDIKTRQKLELGRLLCLEQRSHQVWLDPLNDDDGGLERLQRFEDLAKKIEEQRQKIGTAAMANLSTQGQDMLLKVWYAKTVVRMRFLALRAEQRPLDPETRVGGGSRLGTHEKERILEAIQRRTRTMKNILKIYNQHAQAFIDQFPGHPSSPVIEYGELVPLESDDPFWNYGVFTHSNEPWAVDRGTQMGMRALARLKRCQEEIRRVGWEVRRAMRWATHEHERLWIKLTSLKDTGNIPNEGIQAFMDSPILSSLSSESKVEVVKGSLHNAFVKISNVSLRWDVEVMDVMMRTVSQAGDYELMVLWKSHIFKIKSLRSKGFASTKAGDFNNLFEKIRVGNQLVVFEQDAVDQEDSDVDEDEWAEGIDKGMLQGIFDAVGQE
ncbi:hypothetical protein DFH28DRAFT_1174991 [Melampsora americana]|nr:hypothetical protein DFH28DRAFT_1174991 [Melampsora americana]